MARRAESDARGGQPGRLIPGGAVEAGAIPHGSTAESYGQAAVARLSAAATRRSRTTADCDATHRPPGNFTPGVSVDRPGRGIAGGWFGPPVSWPQEPPPRDSRSQRSPCTQEVVSRELDAFHKPSPCNAATFADHLGSKPPIGRACRVQHDFAPGNRSPAVPWPTVGLFPGAGGLHSLVMASRLARTLHLPRLLMLALSPQSCPRGPSRGGGSRSAPGRRRAPRLSPGQPCRRTRRHGPSCRRA